VPANRAKILKINSEKRKRYATNQNSMQTILTNNQQSVAKTPHFIFHYLENSHKDEEQDTYVSIQVLTQSSQNINEYIMGQMD
jgi:hypothetical protein